jgi:hypothetical protein
VLGLTAGEREAVVEVVVALVRARLEKAQRVRACLACRNRLRIRCATRMKHELSSHVQQEMKRRGIPLAVVESVLAAPGQKLPEHGDVVCYQSKVEINQRPYLVRVVVNETARPPKVVTVYRTSKINKYWKATT